MSPLAAAGEIDKIKYALNAAAADSVHYLAVERIFRKTAVLGLERCGKRVPAERVAAAGIVDDVPAGRRSENALRRRFCRNRSSLFPR